MEIPSQKTKLTNGITAGFAFATGMMLSPDSLVRLGSYFGKTGLSGFAFLILAGVFFLFFSKNIKPFYAGLENSFLFRFAQIFHHSVQFITACFLATGMLVTSGFIFNEVFLYWFPNFAFAFILLTALTVLQFMPAIFSRRLQKILVITSIIGLLVLITSSFGVSQEKIPNYSGSSSIIEKMKSAFFPFLLFIGFDLGFTDKGNSNIKGVYLGIAGIGILFSLWALTSLWMTPAEKLINSSIPHMITAKAAMGETGRYVMGIVVIAGSLAALNALYQSLLRSMSSMSPIKTSKNRTSAGRLIVLCVTAIISIMLLSGVAGHDLIDLYIKSVLLLWLISYGVIIFCVLSCNSALTAKNSLKHKIKFLIIELILILTVLTLVFNDDNPVLISKFLIGAGIIITSISIFTIVGNQHNKI